MSRTLRKFVVALTAIAMFAAPLTVWVSEASAMDPYIGQIQAFGFNFPPRGWAFCDGQLLQISQRSALFSLLGTTFGGDGRTTFGLPDLRGRVAVHPGTGPGLTDVRWGQKGGQERVTLQVGNLPSHSHSILAAKGAGNRAAPEGMVPAGSTGQNRYSDAVPDVAMSPSMVGHTGGGESFEIRSPYLGIYHSIALEGIFPSRN